MPTATKARASTSLGYEVIEAADGHTALEMLIGSSGVELMLSDVVRSTQSNPSMRLGALIEPGTFEKMTLQ